MMRIRYAMPCLCVLLAGATNDPDAPTVIDIPKAIEAFHPPWQSPKGELNGIVIVLAPAADLSAASRDRRCEELTQMTPAYLHHLIRHADGDAVVVENGCLGMREGGKRSAAELASLCAAAKCHLVVRIGFDPALHGAATSSKGDPERSGEATRLARALADALSTAGPLPEVARASSCVPGVPAVEVRFTVPASTESVVESPPPHRRCAEQLYKGIAAFVRANRSELEASRLKQWPAAATGASVIPRVDISPKAKVEKAAQAIWPNGVLPLEKAPWYCATYRAVALSDRTIVHFEPQATIERDTVVLRGTSSVAVLRDTMERALHLVGIEHVRNEMRVLPDRQRLGENLFGVCMAPMALTYAKPVPISHVQTQILYGEPLFLLDRDEGYYLVQAGDGYWGWVREDSVSPMTRERFKEYTASNQAVFLRDVELPEGRVYRGTRLPIVSRDADTVKLMRPDGRELDVPPAAVRPADHSVLANERVQAALKMLYVPYVYGGRSPIGLDCSGLIGNVSEQAGISMARDAAQQFASGRLVATSWYRDDLRPGDRIYFIDAAGKVYHTGLMISPTHFVHSSVPSVQISSLKKGDRLYFSRWDHDFLAAKRP